MKLVGFLLLAAGWVIVLAAVALLPSPLSRNSFAMAGLAIQLLGFGFVCRSHIEPKKVDK